MFGAVHERVTVGPLFRIGSLLLKIGALVMAATSALAIEARTKMTATRARSTRANALLVITISLDHASRLSGQRTASDRFGEGWPENIIAGSSGQARQWLQPPCSRQSITAFEPDRSLLLISERSLR